MIIGRTIGWVLLLAGLVVLARDIFVAAETGTIATIAAGELWFRLDNSSLNLVQAVTQRHLSPFLWDPVMVEILLWPAFAVLAVPGIALAWLCRPRRRKGGFRQ